MATYPVYAIGHDFGNAETCVSLISGSGRIERRIPSVASMGSWQSVITSAHGAGKEVKDILAADHYILEYEHPRGGRVEKFIGQKVFDDGAQPLSSHGAQDRYWKNNYNLEMLMVGSASCVPDAEYGLHVVTGLPIATYLQDAHHVEMVKNVLIGTHEFTLNGRPRTMHVLSVKVMMEGAGALIAYGSHEDVLQGVVDIGGLTTDLYVAKGQKPRASNSHGIKLGVTAAADRLDKKFAATYKYNLSLELRKELLSQFVHHLPLKQLRDKQGVTIDSRVIAGMIESALREIGQEIATKLAALWDDILMELGSILIVGGGAYYFARYIQEQIPLARKAAKPEFANALGYASLAQAVAARAQIHVQKGA